MATAEGHRVDKLSKAYAAGNFMRKKFLHDVLDIGFCNYLLLA